MVQRDHHSEFSQTVVIRVVPPTDHGFMTQWHNVTWVLGLPMAADWAKPFRQRVLTQQSERRVLDEAVLATIEALTRRLRTRGWKRRHTSKRRRDGHADSRYYRKASHEIRISSHPHPGVYKGTQFIITPEMITQYNVLGLVHMIERELK